MSPSPALRIILPLIAAAGAAYGAFVAYQLIDATFIAPRAFGGALWVDALYVASGLLASGIAWGLLPQSTESQAVVAVTLPLRILAVLGFWLPIVTAAYRLIRRFLD